MVVNAKPLGPAGPLRVTVPVDGFPPVTLDGLSVSVSSLIAPIDRLAFCLLAPIEAVMVAITG